ncbi:MAG: YbaK/EbsC family protein [Candidatus Diapherotrites archaeon]|nr:YbaK/EbsC family protein [Candidatus Diapherotrites archaeon]
MSEKETQKVIELFKKYNIQHTLVTHNATLTSQDSARERGGLLSQGVKSMLVKTRDAPVKYLIANIPADKKLDFKKLEQFSGFQNLTMASPAEVLEQTGCELGAVPPLGHKNQLPLAADLKLFENEMNEFNIGQRTVSAKVPTHELKRLFQELNIRQGNITQ